MAGGGVSGKGIGGKGMQGGWFSTDMPYLLRPLKRIAGNSVVAYARMIRLPAIRLPHLPAPGQS
jgi:hypothetical protein